MLIRQKRIRKVKKHLGFVGRGTMLIIGIGGLDQFTDKLKLVGFTNDLAVGEAVLPAIAFGPVSRFNAEGR
jgi:hypothetical protein